MFSFDFEREKTNLFWKILNLTTEKFTMHDPERISVNLKI